MGKLLSIAGRLASVAVVMTLVAACESAGLSRQIAEAQAVHSFDESRLPFGYRIVLAQATYQPRVYGLNPYFGR